MTAPMTRTTETRREFTAAEWDAIVRLLPPASRGGRRRKHDLRAIVRAIHDRERTGCSWRNLPPGSPPWAAVYKYFRRWQIDGTLRRLRPLLEGATSELDEKTRPPL